MLLRRESAVEAAIEPTVTLRDVPGAHWLRRSLALSLVAHVVAVIAMRWALGGGPRGTVGQPGPSVDVEIAPPAPPAEKLGKEKEWAAAAAAAAQAEAEARAAAEAKAAARAARKAKAKEAAEKAAKEAAEKAKEVEVAATDAGADAGALAAVDAGVGDGAAAVAAADDAGAGDGGVDGGAVAAAEEGGDDGGEGASAGTAANLLAYFPENHIITVLLRFDRLRGTEWAEATQEVLAPMPDFRSLVGERKIKVADQFETLVISSFAPRRVDATTLVVHTSMAPAELRRFLDQPDAPVAWSVARGGQLGRRRPGPRVFPGDQRVFLSPFAGWFVLAQPADLAALVEPGHGPLDHAEADPAALPEWLRRVQTIEAASGDRDGPALMLTATAKAKRYKVPDLGFGITSVPAPERLTLSLEIQPQGFVVRGHVRFATEADAVEAERSALAVRAQIEGSRMFQALLRRSRVLNAVKGLTLARSGKRISYATSISIADARQLMTYAAQMVRDWYAGAGAGAAPH